MGNQKRKAVKTPQKTSEEHKGQSTQPKRVRTQINPRNSTQLALIPAPPPLVEIIESPPPDREEAEPEFDGHKFQNAKCVEFYEKVIKHKNIAECRLFDYSSWDQDGLDLFTDFMFGRIYKFCDFHITQSWLGNFMQTCR